VQQAQLALRGVLVQTGPLEPLAQQERQAQLEIQVRRAQQEQRDQLVQPELLLSVF
jgi:hypothetical protein